MAKKSRSRRRNTGGAKQAGDALAGEGHNTLIKTKEVADFFKKLDNIHDKKESENAKHMADIKALYDQAASECGVSRAVFREVYSEHRHQTKLADKYKEWDEEKRDGHDRLMAAAASFGNTPFGIYAQAMAKGGA